MKCSVVGLLGFGAPAQWYVNSAGGDDANGGHSADDALETLTELRSRTLRSGETVWLARGSKWREELVGLPTHVAVRVYGVGARPIIDGSDIVANASFTKTAGRTNIYQFSWTHEFGDSFAGGENVAHRVWENDARMRRIMPDDTLLATALTALDSTPGAFFSPPPTVGTDTIYVHPFGSTNPISDGKTYEAARREFALCLRDSRQHARVYSVHGRRNAHAAGSIVVDGYIDDCWAEDGRVHNIFVRGEAVNCRAFKIEPPAVFGGATMYVSHSADAADEGRDHIYRGCTAEADINVLGPTGAQNSDLTIGFYAHTSGGVFFDTLYYSECSATGVAQGFSGAQLDFGVYYRCDSDARLAVGGFPRDTLVVLGGTYITEADNASFIPQSDDFEVPDNIIVRGARWAGDGANNFPLNINIDLTAVEISRCTIAGVSGGFIWLRDGVFTFRQNIIHGPMVRRGETGEALPGFVADNNLYHTWGGLGFVEATFQTEHAPPNSFTLPQWRVATGQESASVDGDPLFNGSPMAGDFTVQAGSPANTLHAGADYEGEDNDAVLQALLAQYTAGLQT